METESTQIFLLAGQEGTDYKVVDGAACNTDGTESGG